MSDPFEILGLPRRPWLEETAVRRAFQDRARALHPDAAGGDAGRFAALNAAQAVLADPARRLSFLAGNSSAPGMPADAEFGFRIGQALRTADGVLSKPARTPLERALLATEKSAARAALAQIAEELDARFAAADRTLRHLDAVWPDVEEAALAALGAEYRFLQRWRTQLRERELALTL